jgi:hypothetical protein
VIQRIFLISGEWEILSEGKPEKKAGRNMRGMRGGGLRREVNSS